MALGIVLMLALLGGALTEWSYGQSTNAANSAMQKLATQAAQAGIAEYQSLYTADPRFPVNYCSNGAYASSPPPGQSWSCGGGQQAAHAAHIPGYVDFFNENVSTWTGSLGTVATYPNGCQSALPSDTSWSTSSAKGNINTGYQYVVDSSALNPVTGAGTLRLYVTGRAGKPGQGSNPGNFTCVTLATAIQVQGAVPPPTNTFAQDNNAPVNPQGSGSVSGNSLSVQFTVSGGSGGPGGGTVPASGGVGQSINATFTIPSADEVITTVGLAGARSAAGGTGYVNGGVGGNHGGPGGSGSGGGASAACLVPNGNPGGLNCVSQGANGIPNLCTTNAPTAPCVLVIAAGGGGGGEGLNASFVGGAGGNGGYTSGSGGSDGGGTLPGHAGGGGGWNGYSDNCPGGPGNPPNGTQGAAGAPGAHGPGNPGVAHPQCQGGNVGSAASGGDAITAAWPEGGAGGGGYQGGGSGSSGNPGTGGAGGGAGGASYVDGDAVQSGSLFLSSAPGGNGSVSTPVYTSTNTATTTWTYSAPCGTSATVQVPLTASRVTINISGAGGGGGAAPDGASLAGPGGAGASTSVSFPILPSTTQIYANEGCGGGGGNVNETGGVAPATGGWAAGGNGGNGTDNSGFPGGAAGAGGGASAVCLNGPCVASAGANPLLSAPLVVVGGGGGGGATGALCSGYPGPNSNGGNGGTGSPASAPYAVAGAAGGNGNQYAGFGYGVAVGGAGGTVVAAPNTQTGVAGPPGTKPGADGNAFWNAQGGGGGGGGYQGGSAGTGAVDDCNTGPGGGGGSSFAAANAQSPPIITPGAAGGAAGNNSTNGSNGNNGTIVITWTINAPANAAGTSCQPIGIQSTTVSASGKYTAQVAGGGGASSVDSGNGNGGAGGAGALLDLSLTGLDPSQPLAAVAGCQGTAAQGGIGFTTGGSSGPNTCSTYDAAVLATAPSAYFELNDPLSTTHPADESGNVGNSATVSQNGGTGSVNFAQGPGPINCFGSLASTAQAPGDVAQFNPGPLGGYISTSGGTMACAGSHNQPLTLSLWFNTSQPGGLMGCDGGAGSSDRFLYVGQSGHLDFGVTRHKVVTSPQTVTDNTWHHAVATWGPAGETLYVDGQPAAANASWSSTATNAGQYSGTWDIGQIPAAPGQWPDAPNSASYFSFVGFISRVSVTDNPQLANGQTVLSARQVNSLFADGAQACVVDNQLTTLSASGGAFWQLNDSASSIVDYSGNNNTGTANGGVTSGAAGSGPLPCETPPSWVPPPGSPSPPPPADTATWTQGENFDGNPGSYVSTTTQYANPQTFTVEAWFKTADATGGAIMGFGNSRLGNTSAVFDRNLYVGADGRLNWGVYGTCPATFCMVQSPQAVNDGNWHMAVASIGPNGQFLYLDSQLVGYSSDTAAQTNTGWWQVGDLPGSIANWPDEGGSHGPGDAFHGTLGRVAVLANTQLSANTVATLYEKSGYSPGPATCSSYDSAIAALEVDDPGAYWPLNDTGTQAADLSPNSFTGTYSASGVSATQGPLACNPNSNAMVFDGANGQVTTSGSLFNDPEDFSVAAWFKTTGSGVITSFGDGGGNFDRFLWVGADGLLNWETRNGGPQVVQAPIPVNDGQWHFVVATIDGSYGQKLYLDGKLVGANANYTQAGGYTGTWSIGHPTNGSVAGISNQLDPPQQSYFAGSIGRVAVLMNPLTLLQVQSLYADAGYTAPTSVCDVQANPSPQQGYDQLLSNYQGGLGQNPQTQAYWELAERGGNQIYDQATQLSATLASGSIGSGTNPSVANGPLGQCPSAVPNGGALTFKGQAGGGGFTSLSTTGGYGGDLTEMAWVQLPATTNDGGIISLSGSENDHQLWLANQKLYFSGDNTANSLVVSGGTTTLFDHNWHLVTAEIMQGSGEFLYIDGDLVGYNPATPTVTTGGNVTIGTMSALSGGICGAGACPGHATLTGNLSRVAVTQTAIPQGDLRTLYETATGNLVSPAASCYTNALSGNTVGGSPNPPNDIYTLANDATDLINPSNNGTPVNVTFNTGSAPSLCNPSLLAAQFAQGSGSRINLPGSANVTYTQMTVEAWVNLNYTSSINPIIVGTPAVSNNHGFQLWVNKTDTGTGASFQIGTPAQRTANLNRAVGGGWHFLVGVYDGSHVRIYLDGTQFGTSPAANGTVGTGLNPPNIGGTNAAGNTNGDIANVAIYPTVLPDAFIAAQFAEGADGIPSVPTVTGPIKTTNVTPSNTCAAYQATLLGTDPGQPGSDLTSAWTLTDPGATVTDSSNNANNGTLQGPAPPTQGANPGPLGCSAYLPGAPPNAYSAPAMQFGGNGYISTSTQFNNPSGFSVAAWFKTTHEGGIVSFGANQTGTTGGTSADRMLWVGPNGHLWWGVHPVSGTGAGTNYEISSPQSVADGQWHMAVATLDPASGDNLYVDGQQVAHQNAHNAANYSGWWQIGELTPSTPWANETSAPDSFNGTIGQVAILDTAISSSDVGTLYQEAGMAPATNGESQSTCSNFDAAVLANGPQAYLQLNDNNAGTTMSDSSGGFNLGQQQGSGITEGNPGPLNCLLANPGSPRAPSLGLASTGSVNTTYTYTNPENFTEAIWFKSNAGQGGLLSFANGATGDRMLYVGNDNKLYFGINNGGTLTTIASNAAVVDGNWHLAIGVVCGTACPGGTTANGNAPGEYLYLDG
ncbi:MAG TPA: LamG-like jellyroll fold domain-containing protein, partial [Acidimicrobiales bacterium]|nr:LamG-like jellyroll fold domain-containing protein [Acidimicrobiales bacterium]